MPSSRDRHEDDNLMQMISEGSAALACHNRGNLSHADFFERIRGYRYEPSDQSLLNEAGYPGQSPSWSSSGGGNTSGNRSASRPSRPRNYEISGGWMPGDD